MEISAIKKCVYILAHHFIQHLAFNRFFSASSEVLAKSRAVPMDLEQPFWLSCHPNTDSLVLVIDPDTMTNEQNEAHRQGDGGADADQLSVEASIGVFSQEWSMLASDGHSNSQIDVLCKSQALLQFSRQSPSPT